ncbi:MAG: hypothetical protein EZS28_035527 [Streblomastix strix]|uniref:SH3 domain-containing protein n=1 Tax=Streblomastix strix TaxID=222440 RepID=A0A5J4UHC0_9EUKA|nr:MAG: hypothetical protein EZS28_035527 [Streblomastix strix]
MSISSQYFESIADQSEIEGDINYIPVMKCDVVRLIKKDKEWFTVEKDGRIGKVYKGILVEKKNIIRDMGLVNQQSHCHSRHAVFINLDIPKS